MFNIIFKLIVADNTFRKQLLYIVKKNHIQLRTTTENTQTNQSTLNYCNNCRHDVYF